MMSWIIDVLLLAALYGSGILMGRSLERRKVQKAVRKAMPYTWKCSVCQLYVASGDPVMTARFVADHQESSGHEQAIP
jgi:hypothetical protein